MRNLDVGGRAEPIVVVRVRTIVVEVAIENARIRRIVPITTSHGICLERIPLLLRRLLDPVTYNLTE